jgi:hypothetical protein
MPSMPYKTNWPMNQLSFGGYVTLSDPVTDSFPRLKPDIGNIPINMAFYYPILSKKRMKSMIKWGLISGMVPSHKK